MHDKQINTPQGESQPRLTGKSSGVPQWSASPAAKYPMYIVNIHANSSHYLTSKNIP